MNVEPWSTIHSGSHAAPVAGIQYLLRSHGHTVTVDGVFGPATTAAVTAFQGSVGLTADGIVGPGTWPHLAVTTHSGSHGDAVRAVQQFGLLRSPGDTPLAVDGSFGPATAERVHFFQESWGCTLDSIAGRETWSFLSALVPGATTWPLVKVGATQASNWRVLAAQHLLNDHGPSITADGIFGPASGGAVHHFQQTIRTSEISTTVGQLDWPALIITVRLGDHSEAVRAAQTLLPGGLTVDGAFGPLTDAAVRDFQSMFAPPADGIVGPLTWHALTQRLFD